MSSTGILVYPFMVVRPENIKHKYILWLIYALIITHVIQWSVCYALAIAGGQMKYPNFFLSKAMEYDPSRMIANILIPLISIMTAAVLFLRAVLLQQVISTKIQRILWTIFAVCSIILPISMIAVPAIPYSNSNFGHLVPAFLVFVSSFTIMAVSCWLDSSLALPVTRAVKHIRLCLTVGACAGTVVFGIFFWPNPFISSVFELIAAGCMTLFIISLAHPEDFFSTTYPNKKLQKQECESNTTIAEDA